MTRIIIVEDIPRLAYMLREKLEVKEDFDVLSHVQNGQELLEKLTGNHNVDVILMDINMPVMDGITATQEVTERWPHIKIIMSTVFDDEENIFNAILAGASGYLMKDEKPEEIHRAIAEVLEGGAPMSSAIASKALRLIRDGRQPQSEREEYGLTNRETEILEQLSKGLSYNRIAENLYISNGTVRKHIENIYRKLQVNSKIEAVQKASRQRLI